MNLADLPPEIFLDNIFVVLGAVDILRLACTNKYFSVLCSDEATWKYKLQTDFNFSGEGTARTSGWKFIYQRLGNPHVFVWGEKSNGRLGLPKFPKTAIPDVPFPTPLAINARVVSLVAGGMSFHALDMDGNVHVWGTLDGSSYALKSDGFSEAAKPASTPLRLILPSPTKSVSCGRLHSSTLDANNTAWTFLNWGRPFHLDSPILSGPDYIPIQVECGWTYSALLTKSGDVCVWWPFGNPMQIKLKEKFAEMDQDGSMKALDLDGSITCIPWSLSADPVVLPPLPYLPDINTSEPDDGGDEETRLMRIAGFDCHLVGLTNKGHVLKYSSLDNEETASAGSWEYLPQYSELRYIQDHPEFSNGSLKAPQSLKITHISAQFFKFTAYSTGDNSIVLMGDESTTTDSLPQVIPALQYQSVISVVLGDYHCGAVTSTGRLLTWGAYSKGALGLGDPTTIEPGEPGGFINEIQRQQAISRGRGTPATVETPTEVQFDHFNRTHKERFCVSAAAAGWHMGALVIDMDKDDDSDFDETLFEEPKSRNVHPRRPFLPRFPGETPPIMPFRLGRPAAGVPQPTSGPSTFPDGGVFRIGFAGRGRGGAGL